MLCVRRASDILDKYCRRTEHQIAEAFEEARRDGAFLLFDEPTRFLNDRRGSDPVLGSDGGERVLQQLEVFPGVWPARPICFAAWTRRHCGVSCSDPRSCSGG